MAAAKVESKFKIEDFKVSVKEASKDDIARALELLAKDKLKKARIDAGEIKTRTPKYLTEEEKKAAQKLSAARRNAKLNLAYRLYTTQVGPITEEMIDNYMAENNTTEE